MASITSVTAWANNEVAFIAWATDGRIPGCLGFEVVRVIVHDDGSEERVNCATWVPFKGQNNPDWLPQDSGVWPVQKFSWRDLTARKKRNGMKRRPDELTLRYEIRPLGKARPGLERVPSNGLEQGWIARRDANGQALRDAQGRTLRTRGPAYQGKPRALAYLGPAAVSNAVRLSTVRGPFRTAFTNGILSAQWLANVLDEDGTIGRNELLDKLSNPKDPHRAYLAGDVLTMLRELFARPGRFLLALYELEDEELEQLIVAQAGRVRLILANTGADSKGAWDKRNAPARARLKKAKVQQRGAHRSQQVRRAPGDRWRAEGRIHRQHQLDVHRPGGADQQCPADRGQRGGAGVCDVLAATARRPAAEAQTQGLVGDERQPAGRCLAAGQCHAG
jgi:hypothetical protein